MLVMRAWSSDWGLEVLECVGGESESENGTSERVCEGGMGGVREGGCVCEGGSMGISV